MKWLIAISVSSVIVGGIGILSIISPSAPRWDSIREGFNDEKDSTYNGKYAENYLDYFVDTKNEDNIKWWTWSFNKNYSSGSKPTEGGFKDVRDGKSLGAACKKAYESNKSEKIKGEGATVSSDDEFKELDIWKYCSPNPKGQKVKSLREAPGTSGSGGEDQNNTYGKEENKDKFISTETDDNDWFWKVKGFLFYMQGKGMWKDDENKDSEFRNLYMSIKGKRVFFSKGEALKNKCKEAYGKKTDTDAEQYPEAEVFKFCSIKGSK